MLVLVLALRFTVSDVFDIPEHLDSAATVARLVVSHDAQGERIAEQRAVLSEGLQVADVVLDRIGSSTVHVVPIDAAIVYLDPSLHWQPLPIIQDYANYTEELDELQSAALTGEQRPRSSSDARVS